MGTAWQAISIFEDVMSLHRVQGVHEELMEPTHRYLSRQPANQAGQRPRTAKLHVGLALALGALLVTACPPKLPATSCSTSAQCPDDALCDQALGMCVLKHGALSDAGRADLAVPLDAAHRDQGRADQGAMPDRPVADLVILDHHGDTWTEDRGGDAARREDAAIRGDAAGLDGEPIDTARADIRVSADQGLAGPEDASAADCAAEDGWICSGPSCSCLPLCGDGIKLQGEDCDDGNTLSHDGCSSSCQTEQLKWSRLSTNAPEGRYAYALAYDEHRQVTVLFGGRAGDNSCKQDTMELGDDGWSIVPLETSPPALAYGKMVYHPGRQKVLMFGGWNGVDDVNTTYEYDGAEWAGVTSALKPPVRRLHGLVYDPVRGVVVLFGGVAGDDSSVPYFNDTWGFSPAGQWTEVATGDLRPPPLTSFAMAYDPRVNKIVLTGGYRFGSPLERGDQTWEYTSPYWYQVGPSPADQRYIGMVYFPELDTLVLHGGYLWNDGSAVCFSDTWTYTGIGVWTKLESLLAVSPRLHHELVYDSQRRRIIAPFGKDCAGVVTDTAVLQWVAQ